MTELIQYVTLAIVLLNVLMTLAAFAMVQVFVRRVFAHR